MTWWSYDATNNPRVAKYAYLEEHHDEYDSYIVGCSSTSSYPTEALNRYFDASFYNLINYGADMLDTEQQSRYLIEHYNVKNLIVNVYIDNGFIYNDESNPLTHSMPWQMSGTSPIAFYRNFLFANPRYGYDKIQKKRTDSLIQAPHDVFNEKTGAYDKSVRDIEPISDLETYYKTYPVFQNYPVSKHRLTQIESTMKSLTAIRDLCAEKGINFVVVCSPIYYDYFATFERADIEAFYTALAAVTPFWDYSVSSVSREPRYFYDATHFRNAVGDMALAKMFDDTSVYVPEDFGVYVTPENVKEHISGFWNVPALDDSSYTAEVPVLMYHHLAAVSENSVTMSVSQFEKQLAALKSAGYTTVFFEDLYDYVYLGKPLPEKPVVITLDDGYTSNLELGLPILKKYNMKATIFIIGVSVGKDTYKDTGVAMTPHFSIEQAKALEESGLVKIHSHGYDIHQVEGLDTAPIRQGAYQKQGESEQAYVDFLRGDLAHMQQIIHDGLGHDANVLSYPYGYHSILSDMMAKEAGVYATTSVIPGMNTLIQGLPQSLYALKRYAPLEETTPDALLEMLTTDLPSAK